VLSVDRTKPGFQFLVFQNESAPPTTLAEAEAAVAGLALDQFGFPLDNNAERQEVGVALDVGVLVGKSYKFEIPAVINLSQTDQDVTGAFTPDGKMPGVPGIFLSDDGISAELITYIDLPSGLITMGVVSDDQIRVRAGKVSAQNSGLIVGETEFARTNTFKFVVQTAGVYGFRAVYFDNTGAANIEWFNVKADASWALLNDTANGGFATYRTGVAPTAGFSVGISETGGQILINWTEPGTILQQSTDMKTWSDVAGAVSPYNSIPAGRSSVFFRLKK